jgi:hypothetical protein
VEELMGVHKARAKTPLFRAAAYTRALETIGKLDPGTRMVGLTKGQFSLLDLIRAVLVSTGPADLVVSTWTAGIRDVDNVGFLVERGQLRSLRLLCDRSFPRRQPKYCRRVLEVFGESAIRCTRTHAKFALISNEDWKIVIRSSMNLNRNPRFEQFDLDDDPDIFEFFQSHWAEIETTMPEGLDVSTATCDRAFAGALGGGLVEGALEETSPIDIGALLAEVSCG